MKKLQTLLISACLCFLGGLVPPFYCSYASASEYTTPLPTNVEYNPASVFEFMRLVSDVFKRYGQTAYLLGPRDLECENYCDDLGIYTTGWSLADVDERALGRIIDESLMIATAYGFSVHLQKDKLFFHYSPKEIEPYDSNTSER